MWPSEGAISDWMLGRDNIIQRSQTETKRMTPSKQLRFETIRIGLVARICRSQSSQDDQFRQGRGSIPRFGIVPFCFLVQ
jgi:hypothetical protein